MADTSIDNGSDFRDSIIEETSTNTISTSIYDIEAFVDAIKAKYINLPEDTLALGVYGYLNEIHSNILENTAIIASEYSNEAIPTRAQFERNVIRHALSLGITSIMATPASIEVYLCFPESAIVDNMQNNLITIDKEFEIVLSSSDNSTGTSYVYRLDYDIVIRRSRLPNGELIYTAMYDIDDLNQISTITSPYLPTIGRIRISNDNMLAIRTTLRQCVHTQIYKKIIVSNPLEFKAITFTFPDQLAYFYVEVNEAGTTHYLQCIYDGLYDTNPSEEYCNYQYIDDSSIRITFNRDSYQPRENADVTIHVFTTNGADCNFSYSAQTVHTLSSSRFSYNQLYMVVQPISDSEYGMDRKSIDEIHQVIPKEMLSRDSITTSKDLAGYFNQISENYKMYFLPKLHNQISRIFFSYILLKDNNNNIVPTNTVDVTFGKEMFHNINTSNYILQQGAIFYNDGETTKGITSDTSDEQLALYEESGFLYTTPFLIVINKNPFLVSYYLTAMNYGKSLGFDYINEESQLQFIPDSTVNVRREALSRDEEARNTYRINLTLIQNISSDFDIIGTNEVGDITRQDIQVYAVIYNRYTNVEGAEEVAAYKYIKANPLANGDYDDSEYIYNFELDFQTNDIIDRNERIQITSGLYELNTEDPAVGYLSNNVEIRFFILVKLEEEYGRGDEIDSYVPNLDGWTLCNVYSMTSGMDVYYNYTNIMESYVTIHTDKTTGAYAFDIKRMPLVKYSYLSTSDSVDSFIRMIDVRRSYIQACLVLLEDSFGVDFKFFNTYGPSKLYNVNEEVMLDRVNISLTFEIKYQTTDDIDITNDITQYIKDYIENINYITDLHMPNLTTAVKNKFVKQLVYFKFVGLNNYGYMYQSIYQNPVDAYTESTDVPEFININTLADGSADITYTLAPATQDDTITNNMI